MSPGSIPLWVMLWDFTIVMLSYIWFMNICRPTGRSSAGIVQSAMPMNCKSSREALIRPSCWLMGYTRESMMGFWGVLRERKCECLCIFVWIWNSVTNVNIAALSFQILRGLPCSGHGSRFLHCGAVWDLDDWDVWNVGTDIALPLSYLVSPLICHCSYLLIAF